MELTGIDYQRFRAILSYYVCTFHNQSKNSTQMTQIRLIFADFSSFIGVNLRKISVYQRSIEKVQR